MKVDIVSIFPEYFAPLALSLIGKARSAGLLDIVVYDLRRWTQDVHRTVDDSPYGGGPGMVMRPEPWGEAIDALANTATAPEPAEVPFGRAPGGCAATAPEPAEVPFGRAPGGSAGTRLVVPSPAGEPFSQAMARSLAREQHLLFACGRYEGIDQRVVDHAATRMPVSEVSLGDYVLFGGEVAVLVMLEAIVRLLPGVLGNADSLLDESHAGGLLEAPMYTKPPIWRGLVVPEILRSGDHGRIARWRREQALARTEARRPDLLAKPPEGRFQVDGPDVAK